jgi:retron-type reverse transcriptase
MLKAGYLKDWTWNATHSGCPQGGVVSPILSNICLDRLDKFVETVLIPQYNRGEARATDPAYKEISDAMFLARKRGDSATVQQLRKQRQPLPSKVRVLVGLPWLPWPSSS